MNRKLVIALGCCLLLLIAGTAKAQAPVADFKGDATSGCGPLAIRFTDLSTNAPLFWVWDFGNGQTSTLQNPLVTYNNAGTYTVSLTVRNKDGVDTKQKVNYIVVFPYPHASFINDLSLACLPASIQFTDQSTPAGGINAWKWDFGDGATSTLQNPSHAYSTVGYFDVSLTVSNPGGCTNKLTGFRAVRIVDGVTPNFAFDQTSLSCLAPYTVNFLNQTAGPGTLTYNWSLGSGASPANSAAQNPTNVSYPSSTNYTVTLQVSSSLGCGGTIQKTLPFGSYAAKINGPDTVCLNSPVTFSNASTPVPSGMTWKFGDGSTANNSPTTKTYKTIGLFPLTLVNRYSGCVDSTTETIQVAGPPTPAFTAIDTAACKAPLTVSFTDATTGGAPVQWHWDFGDGSTSNQQSPQHTYNQPGSFNVTLTVTGSGGCPVSITKKGLVNIKAPTVTINNANNLGACINSGPGDVLAVSPSATINSVDPPTGYTYSWSAPGSVEGTSNSSNPTFHYTSQNTYTITVTVTSPVGCQVTSPPATILIGLPNVSVTYTITPNPVCGRDSVAFTASGPADQYLWNFGDGNTSGPVSLQTINHSYEIIGNFFPSLTVINHGCPYTNPTPLTITVNPPIAKFGYKVINCPYTVNFLDSSLVVGTATYSWDFDEGGNTSAQQNPTYVYTTLGVHHVKLTVTNGSCPPQSYTRDIFLGQITVAATTTTPIACKNREFVVANASIINPGNNHPGFIAAYDWTITPTVFVSEADSIFKTHITTNGTYSLTLKITDSNGCIWTSAGTVATIQITSPTANFTTPAGACKNSSVPFTDHSTVSPVSNKSFIDQVWEFDTTTFIHQIGNIAHTYTDTGYFNASMTVTDAMGCTDTYTSSDSSLQITSPYAAFSGPDSFYCPGVPLQFVDSSFGYGIIETWDFGDGTGTAAGPSPAYTYATPGRTYPVKLTVTDRYNCVSTYSKNIDIEKPVAAFDIADTTSICTPLQTLFTAHTQFIDSLYWDFGDGTTSTLPVTSHFYNTFGDFRAVLHVQGPGGCTDTVGRRIQTIDPTLTTSILYSPLSACDSVPVQFDIATPPYTKFTLIYDDNVFDSSQNLRPFHMYYNPNSYRPRLALTDSTGCFVNINGASLITVLGSAPFFSIDKHKFCDSSIVTFIDYTFSNNGIDSETYVFGDGSPSQTLSPGTGGFNVRNFFTRVGVWPVSLKVSTDSGCRETYTDTVFVYQTPHPVITVISNPCAGIIQFQGSLTQSEVDTIKWNWNFGNGQTSGVQNPAVKMNPGNYNVTLIASVSLGCTDTTSDNLTIHPIPLVSGPKEITTPLGIPVTIPFAYSAGVTSYEWNPATNLDCPTCPEPVATLLLSTQYIVTVTDSSGCKSTDSIFIRTICNTDNLFMPNTFSPNGDGVNDVFYPRGKSLYNVQSLTVFNRWGQMVFQRRDFPANTESMGWDGKVNGKPASSDAYVYIVEVICENAQVVAIHGTVTLLR